MVGAHQFIPFHNEIDSITQGDTGVDVRLNHAVVAKRRVVKREAIMFIQQMRAAAARPARATGMAQPPVVRVRVKFAWGVSCFWEVAGQPVTVEEG